MDKKFYGIDDNNDLLDFLNDSDTYVEDKNSFIVGDKKTGVMFDKRTGKVFNEDFHHSVNKGDDMNSKKYDFLEYKRSIDVLNSSDEIFKKDDLIEKEVVLKEDSLNKSQESNKDIILKKNLL